MVENKRMPTKLVTTSSSWLQLWGNSQNLSSIYLEIIPRETLGSFGGCKNVYLWWKFHQLPIKFYFDFFLLGTHTTCWWIREIIGSGSGNLTDDAIKAFRSQFMANEVVSLDVAFRPKMEEEKK